MTEPDPPVEPLPSEAPQRRGVSPATPAAAADVAGLLDPEGGDGTMADAGPMELVRCPPVHLHARSTNDACFTLSDLACGVNGTAGNI